jgi:hypothetical protein
VIRLFCDVCGETEDFREHFDLVCRIEDYGRHLCIKCLGAHQMALARAKEAAKAAGDAEYRAATKEFRGFEMVAP